MVVIRQDQRLGEWVNALTEAAPDIPVYNYLEDHPRNEVKMAVVWKHPDGSLSCYPHLGCIASSGAGVDFIFDDPEFPKGVPVSRVVDPFLTADMSEFVIARIFAHIKNLNIYSRDQRHKSWHPLPYRRSSAVCVGILGMGALGGKLALDLLNLNFRVVGWSRSPKNFRGATMYSGADQLATCLAHSDILVCLLPLTRETRGILNSKHLALLPRGAYLINVARGAHLVDADLLEALETGHLAGASLDVFHSEPLPADHPFWIHEAIQLSPHVASVSDIASVTPQLIENYRRLEAGKALLNPVSRLTGY